MKPHAWILLAGTVALFAACDDNNGTTMPATGLNDGGADGRFCSATADAVLGACNEEAEDDYLIAFGKCINVGDDAERSACFADADTARTEARQDCVAQRAARGEACATLGEARYDPDFDPALFDEDFGALSNPNRYFPLAIGNRWEYSDGEEEVVVEVLDKTKLIEGVTCIVVRDTVSEDEAIVEDTNDWFAQAMNGDVWYCGEQTAEFESFEGDEPEEPELVDIEGAFKAGRDGDKPGILFLGEPAAGAAYRQEFSLNNAEDIAEVLSTSYRFGMDAVLDQHVPEELGLLFCAADVCVVTLEYTPLSPGGRERKYYARDVGLFLETDPDEGPKVQLVDCNFDPRCMALPEP